jgi:RNA polymerase sigma factor (sigma-70 family)
MPSAARLRIGTAVLYAACVKSDPPVQNPALDAAYREDAALVARALGGDRRAWDEIVQKHGGLVFATARRAGLTRDDAADVAQSVFAALLRSLGRVRDGERLVAWLVTSTKRESWRVGRSRARRAGGDDALAGVAAPDDASAEIAAVDRRRTVAAALASIDERCREILRALFFGGGEQDYTAIGARFGIAVNSVGPIRNRCLRRMLEALQALGFEPSQHGFPVPTTATEATDNR